MMYLSRLSGLLLATLVLSLRAEEKPAAPANSANWLVDAMAEKPAASRKELRADATHRDRGLLPNTASPYSLPQNRDANPLSSYLATWMTPRDIEILKIKEAADGGTTRPSSTPRSRSASGAPQSAPAPNPYLVELAPPTSPSAKIAVPPPPPLPPSLAAPAPKKDAPAKTAGPPPDLLKAQEEQKYFPQLKRF
jgi:hypothetical protein